MKTYLHQVWLLLMCLVLFAGLFMPIGLLSNYEGATAELTNFRVNFVEGDSVGAMWGLAVIQIVSLLVSLFELLLSGFRNFTLQKRLLIFNGLVLIGWYIVYVAYVLLMKNDASFQPQWAAAFPFIALVLDVMTLIDVFRTEAAIIAGAGSFRLRD